VKVIIISIVVLVILLLVFLPYGIPEGWEDENGFHYGKKK
jgi:hypothetical protein